MKRGKPKVGSLDMRDLILKKQDSLPTQLDLEELNERDTAYKIWEKELEDAIASGDEGKINEALENGK